MVTDDVTVGSDEALALRAGQRDHDAFATLYERYFPSIYDFAARTLKDRDRAGDVAQSTFIEAWTDLQRGQEPRNFKAWLFTIARHNALDEIRRSKRLVSTAAAEGGDEELVLQYARVDASRLDSPQEAAQDNEYAATVWDAAAALNAKEYTLLDMELRQHLSVEEIADALGVRRGNVHTMMSRLRDALAASVSSLMLMRRGRDDCEELDALLVRLDAREAITPQVRRAVQKHVRSCEVCAANERKFVAPAEIFAGLGILAAGSGVAEGILQNVSAQTTANVASGSGGSGGGGLARLGDGLGRWWEFTTAATKAAVLGGAAVVTVVVVVVVALAAGGGGDDGEDRVVQRGPGTEATAAPSESTSDTTPAGVGGDASDASPSSSQSAPPPQPGEESATAPSAPAPAPEPSAPIFTLEVTPSTDELRLEPGQTGGVSLTFDYTGFDAVFWEVVSEPPGALRFTTEGLLQVEASGESKTLNVLLAEPPLDGTAAIATITARNVDDRSQFTEIEVRVVPIVPLVEVLRFDMYDIPLDGLRSAPPDSCAETHYHAASGGVAPSLQGPDVPDPEPGGCGYGAESQVVIVEVPDLRIRVDLDLGSGS